MPKLFEAVTDLASGADALRRRRYGVIETAGQRLIQVRLRPFPKCISLPEIALAGKWRHRRVAGDRCLLYYSQPRGHSGFLVLKYVVSSAGTSLATFRLSLSVLDEIARFKRSDALLCDASNLRISDRLLARWGWSPHCPSRWHRHFIKRFYGRYPGAVAPAACEAGVVEVSRPDESWHISDVPDLSANDYPSPPEFEERIQPELADDVRYQ